MRGGKLSWEDLLLLDSVFIITAAVHRGNLAGYIKRLIHSPPTTSDTHTTRHTHTHPPLGEHTGEINPVQQANSQVKGCHLPVFIT